MRRAVADLTEARQRLDAVPEPRRAREHVRLARLERRADARRIAFESPPILEALAFAGLAVEPFEVSALANLIASMLFAPAILGFAAIILLGGPLFVSPLLLSVPLLGYVLVLGYPPSVAKRARRAAYGETPEVANYLAMSLRVRPSLDRAIAFASEHGDGPLASRLRRALWEVHVRTSTRVEAAFTALADAVGPWNPDWKRASYVVAHAVREGSREGIARALDRALSIVYDGTRRRLQDYAASLRGPTTALFALGVLLPLVVGSMLPLLSLSGFSPTALEVMDPRPADPLPWILLLDVAFPAMTFGLAHHVSCGRPGRDRGCPSAQSWKFLGPLGFVAASAVVASVAFPGAVSPLAAVGVIVGGLAVAAHLTTRDAARERRRSEALEREFPDALFQLGTRLGEGRGLDDSFLAVADGLHGTAAGDLFGRIARSLRLGGGTVEAALFGPDGALAATNSRTVRATLRMVVDIAAKDPATAGRATIEMSSHLRDLEGVERDLRAELRPTVDAMRATAAFFGPVVLGVTGALYALLSEAFAGFAALPMDPPVFHAALGVYLVLTTAAILHFASRIEGGGAGTFGAGLARTLPLGYGLFAATLLLAGLAL